MGICIINGTKSLTPPEVISNETLSRHNLYGVSFNGTSSAGKPLYNAIDQKWTPATPSDLGVDTWKDIAPFNVKKCITDYDASEAHKRKVLAYEGDSNYDSLKAAKTGDRMVEFPLGYYYRPDKWTFIVSPDPIEGFQPSPACDLGNGTILDGFRLSEFDLSYVSAAPRSIPGAGPWVSVAAQTVKDALKTKGQYMETFGAWCWINFLAAIKHQNLNSQKVNGMGIHAGNATRTMTEDNIQGLDGFIGLSNNDNVRTLGLQNFYGHVWDFLHNVIVRSASKVWIKKDFIHAESWPTYSDAVTEGWEELSMPLPGNASDTFVSEMAWNSAESWALYPSKYGGNDVEPIGDACWNASNDPFSVVLVGGNAWNGSSDGALYWNSNEPLSNVNVNIGARSFSLYLVFSKMMSHNSLAS